MTVNELIAQLQVLSAQGHGELDVAVYIPYDCGNEYWTANTSVEVNDECVGYYKDIDGDNTFIKQGKFVGIF